MQKLESNVIKIFQFKVKFFNFFSKAKREKHVVSTCLNCGEIKRYNLYNKNVKTDKKSKRKQKKKEKKEKKKALNKKLDVNSQS